MSTYESPYRNRVYKRKFDYEEAQKLRREGWTLAALARKYRVTPTAVARATDSRTRARMDSYVTEYQKRNGNPWNYRGVCAVCGGKCRTGVERCQACYLDTVRIDRGPDEKGRLMCVRCREWHTTDVFSFDADRPMRGFRRNWCRSCEAKARRDYRERHKIPCDNCGKPRLPANEKKKPGVKDSGLCRDCWLESRRAA